MFIYNTMIHLKDTDATGVLYFAQQFSMALKTWESFLAHSGLSLGEILETTDFLMPIVHAEADYRAPLRVGDRIEIDIATEKIGTTSFTTKYRLMKDGLIVGTVKLVHVTVSKTSKEPIALPKSLLDLLQQAAPCL